MLVLLPTGLLGFVGFDDLVFEFVFVAGNIAIVGVDDVLVFVKKEGLRDGLKVEGAHKVAFFICVDSVFPAFLSYHRFYFAQGSGIVDRDRDEFNVVFF